MFRLVFYLRLLLFRELVDEVVEDTIIILKERNLVLAVVDLIVLQNRGQITAPQVIVLVRRVFLEWRMCSCTGQSPVPNAGRSWS